MNCIHCGKTVDYNNRVNHLEDIFCNDHCYEEHLLQSERSYKDKFHPYIHTIICGQHT